MSNKINFFHSIIFFIISIFLSPFGFLKNENLIFLCLFFIMTIGISHGALDNIKGRKLLNILKIKNIFFFYFSYVIISILIIVLWLLFSNLVFIIFLIVASYHFGKEDTFFKINIEGNLKEILFFLKGSVVISAPLLFFKEETIIIFKMLNFDFFEKIDITNELLILCLFISLFANLFLSRKQDLDTRLILLIDFFAVVLLNFFLKPILAFTIYFCFLHSIRHILSLMSELDNNINVGLLKFVKKSFPLTMLTAFLYIISIYVLNNFFELSNAIYKVIFIGLASLTFPHILLEYLIEKNENEKN